jgi:hypothetical protein
MKISNESMIAAYEVAKRIRERALSRAAGIEELHQRFGLNRGSASDTIGNIGLMLEGKRYVRTNNAFTTEHFLEMIHRDYGLDALNRAISAVEKHLEYYEKLPRGSKLPKIRKIVQKYRSIAIDGRTATGRALPTENEVVQDLKEIDQERNVDPTTKKALVDARLGQGLFRTKVLHSWGNCCSVTGSTIQAAIRASHIKPWRESSNSERLYPDNGLPLIASLDALFDAGLISFESSGKLIVSSKVSTTERDIFRIREMELRKEPTAGMREYLAYHRAKHGFKW